MRKRKQKYNSTPIKIVLWLTLASTLALSFQALALDLAYDFPIYGHASAVQVVKDFDRLEKLTNAIAKKEGYYLSGTLARRNNNPGNLVYAGQPHAVRSGRWAKFDTVGHGFQALQAQIKLDARRGLTLEQFIYKYAPPKENDTLGYIQYVAKQLTTTHTTKLSTIIQ